MQSAKAIFSERLKEMLELREKSQAQLAKELDTTPQAISSYVKGKTTPDYDMLCRIAGRLNVSVDFLLGNVQTLSGEEQQLMSTDQSETDSDLFLHTFRRFAVVRDALTIPLLCSRSSMNSTQYATSTPQFLMLSVVAVSSILLAVTSPTSSAH